MIKRLLIQPTTTAHLPIHVQVNRYFPEVLIAQPRTNPIKLIHILELHKNTLFINANAAMPYYQPIWIAVVFDICFYDHDGIVHRIPRNDVCFVEMGAGCHQFQLPPLFLRCTLVVVCPIDIDGVIVEPRTFNFHLYEFRLESAL